jgi:hypothetical protein
MLIEAEHAKDRLYGEVYLLPPRTQHAEERKCTELYTPNQTPNSKCIQSPALTELDSRGTNS